MTDHEFHDLAAPYALDALDDDERALFEAHHSGCETCAAEVIALRETAALLTTESQPPPDHVRAAVMEAIVRTPQVPPLVDAVGSDIVELDARRRQQPTGPATTRPSTNRVRGLRLLQAAAVVAVFAAGVLLGASRDTDEATVTGEIEYAGPIGLERGSIGELSVTATGIGRVIRLETDELAILPTGEYYELWFVAPDDSDANPNRISAGTFHPDPDGTVDVRFAAAVDPRLYPTIEITAEPADGDPAATGPVVASITIDS